MKAKVFSKTFIIGCLKVFRIPAKPSRRNKLQQARFEACRLPAAIKLANLLRLDNGRKQGERGSERW
mgnify:CR=1 FL=1